MKRLGIKRSNEEEFGITVFIDQFVKYHIIIAKIEVKVLFDKWLER